MKRIVLLLCAMVVMAGTSAQTENKNNGVKGLLGFLKKSASQLSKKKNNKTKTKSYWEASKTFAENVPLIEIDQPISPETGLKLTKTNTIGGLKCDHYEKDGMKLRVFYKENGDYFVTNEDPDGMNREPNDDAQALGRWRISEKKYSWYGGFKYPFLKWNEHNYSFSQKDELEVDLGDFILIQDLKGNQSYYLIKNKHNPSYIAFKNGDLSWSSSLNRFFAGVRLANDKLNVYYPNCLGIFNRPGKTSFGIDRDNFPITVLVGDWLCEWDMRNGVIGAPFAQIYENWAVYATPNNKVASIDIDERITNKAKVTYENGDGYRQLDSELEEAKLHIGKDVLVIKSDGSGRIEYADDLTG